MRSLLLAALLPAALAAPAAQWRDENRIIYQVITDRFALKPGARDTCNEGSCPYGNYCGGTHGGIEAQMDYIQAMNFSAVWISPVVDNFECGYHGYWARDWYKVSQEFGGADELRGFVESSQKRGVWVMEDIVLNHAGFGDINQRVPFNRPEHYHPQCEINFADQNSVENCWLVNLPDLNQENPWVRSTLVSWLKNLKNDYKFDGIRIDTVPYVPKDTWREATAALEGTYTLGEVLIERPIEYYAAYQFDQQRNYKSMDAVLNYPLFWALREAFGKQQSLQAFGWKLKTIYSAFQDPTILGTFLDCHDQPRFLYEQKDWTLYKNGLLTVIASIGVPIVYYGSEQAISTGGSDDANRYPLWRVGYNREHLLFKFTAQINSIKRAGLFAGAQREIWATEHTYMFTRGTPGKDSAGERCLVVVSNLGSGKETAVYVQRKFLPQPFQNNNGQVTVCDKLNEGACVTVGAGMNVQIKNGQPQVWCVVEGQNVQKKLRGNEVVVQ